PALQRPEQSTGRGARRTPQADGDQRRFGGVEERVEQRRVGQAAGAEEEPRVQRLPGDHEAHPPCTAVTISTTSPSANCLVAWSRRGTTSPLTAAALPCSTARSARVASDP